MIKIYNTLTKNKELIENKTIKIYTCGITVYDHCHIGHARIFLLFDSLIRYLKSINIKIILIRNITDIDDKIIEKARKKKCNIKSLTRHFTKEMHNNTKKLNIIEPTYEPKATEFIPEMISIIKKLKKDKYAYKNEKCDIYFNINNYEGYGILSNRKNLKESYRNKKKDKNNFVLWKKNKKNEPIYWQTQWGNGRPGWHTECAAMLLYYNKNYIDIHGGGQDLLFPHHENEMTQCKSFLKRNPVKIWMHVGQLKINKKKMSKSKKNFILIKKFLKNFNEECLRFYILSTNYKKSINFDLIQIKRIKKTLDKLYEVKSSLKEKKYKINEKIETLFTTALQDNFNTPKAISILFKSLNNKNEEDDRNYTIIEMFKKIGLLKYKTITNSKIIEKNIEKIKKLIKEREIARKNKDWKLADKIREKLNNMNVKINDNKNKTTFKINQ
jgi:cysteinyl-tRNA synthetase